MKEYNVRRKDSHSHPLVERLAHRMFGHEDDGSTLSHSSIDLALEHSGGRSKSIGQIENMKAVKCRFLVDDLSDNSLVIKRHGSDIIYYDDHTIKSKIIGYGSFVSFCLAFGICLANIWRFPAIAYKHQGGAFVLAYSVLMVFVGIPLFFMEIAFGQFSSGGPGTARCWAFCPISRGVGLAMMIVSMLVTVPYSMAIALASHYFVNSFKMDLPWLACVNGSDCFHHEKHKYGRDEDKTWDLETNNYFHKTVLESNNLLICYLVGWFMTWLVLFKGMKLVARMIYVIAFVPYVIMIVLLIIVVNLDGGIDGVSHFFHLDWSVFLGVDVWVDAVVQLYYSLSVSFGALILLSSTNYYHFDCLQYSLILTLTNYFTSLLVGLVFFCCTAVIVNDKNIDFYSFNQYADPADNTQIDMETLFIIFPMALSYMPLRWMCSAFVFGTVIGIGINNQLILITTVTHGLHDVSHKFHTLGWLLRTMVCSICCMIGVPMVTESSLVLFAIVDYEIVATNVLIVSICEVLPLVWIYGSSHFLRDIDLMIGTSRCCCIPWSTMRKWFNACWFFFMPILLLIMLILHCLRCIDRNDYAQEWQLGVSVILQTASTVVILVSIIVFFYKTPGSLRERLKHAFSMSSEFGPVVSTHRASFQARNSKTSTNMGIIGLVARSSFTMPMDYNQSVDRTYNDTWDDETLCASCHSYGFGKELTEHGETDSHNHQPAKF